MAERFKTPDDATRLGARMRSARKNKGYTLVFVATHTGVDAGQLSKLERGQMATVSENVQKICTYLQIPATTGNPPPTRAGSLLDELVASLPGSEPAVARLVTAIQEMVLSVAAHCAHKKDD
ncbi:MULTISPECIES: helix-turn-helix domain-containing protein [unclassified Lysobacter]|uniref:helix-turn-helix domain-containing protein n=1 Tax=unclassified Lysobacter TaxID=2635362 RepID=UPI001BE948A5|nr:MULTISPECIES: helix-turn-helix domain-containing protein [unclassified Lysobacter]MBT2748306.1 helix-turn-helix transcriptional regulator [Lysobacter sp. ISL-42]MBT2749927.1 helix-turn-helix transcriptional regulator [Lysobacter sp. ISL-50]MBT2781255.1 helix-turn-helix transcriptional regulator [Lysobacter sp. ISL-52]